MDLEAIGGETLIKSLINNIRSEDENERKSTISQIPGLILQAYESKNDILNQLLLVIYNLNTKTDHHDSLDASNRTLIFRNLLRLYADSIQEHSRKQILALTKLIDIVYPPELLVELAYVLHQCIANLNKENAETVEEALSMIQEKAAITMNPEALLMIHSIFAIK